MERKKNNSKDGKVVKNAGKRGLRLKFKSFSGQQNGKNRGIS